MQRNCSIDLSSVWLIESWQGVPVAQASIRKEKVLRKNHLRKSNGSSETPLSQSQYVTQINRASACIHTHTCTRIEAGVILVLFVD